MAKEANNSTKTGYDYLDKLPENIEAERKLLSCLFILGESSDASDYIAKIDRTIFASESNKLIFDAIEECSRENAEGFEYIIVSNKMKTTFDAYEQKKNGPKKSALDKIGGMKELLSIISLEKSAGLINSYLEVVRQAYVSRSLIVACKKIIASAQTQSNPEALKAEAENIILSIGDIELNNRLQHINESAARCIKEIQDIISNIAKPSGFRTGFRRLDDIINGGMQPSQYVVVAARPGCGKTAFALNIVCNALIDSMKYDNPKPLRIALFNQEMSSDELTHRILTNLTGFNKRDIKLRAKVDILSQYNEYLKLFRRNNIYIDDTTGITPDEIASKCRRLYKKHGGLDLIVIDYLTLLTVKNSSLNKNRQNEVAEISRRMKILAKDLHVPVLVLSQLSRDIEKREANSKNSAPENPKLSDLRESGAIEQDADIVMFIYKTEKDANTADNNDKVLKISVAKNRSGQVGDIPFIFSGAKMKFKEMTIEEESKTWERNNEDSQKSEQLEAVTMSSSKSEGNDYDEATRIDASTYEALMRFAKNEDDMKMNMIGYEDEE